VGVAPLDSAIFDVTTRRASLTDWKRIASESPNATYFHTHEWAEILSATYPSIKPMATVCRLPGGAEVLFPVALMRRRWGMSCLESMPMGGYGGPVSEVSLNREHLGKLCRRLLRPWIWTLAVYPSPTAGMDLSPWCRSVEFYAHVLTLEGGFRTVWGERFDRKTRNQVRKAERSGVDVSLAASLDEWRRFAALYRRKASEWGWPGYPAKVFELLAGRSPPQVRLWLARKGGGLLSGLVVLSWGRSAVPWASAMEEGAGSLCPNHALYRAAVEEACREERRWFNFGSSRGLARLHLFKESFGARRVDYQYYRWEPAWKKRIRGLRRSRGAGGQGGKAGHPQP
jgi:hypothetical protein